MTKITIIKNFVNLLSSIYLEAAVESCFTKDMFSKSQSNHRNVLKIKTWILKKHPWMSLLLVKRQIVSCSWTSLQTFLKKSATKNWEQLLNSKSVNSCFHLLTFIVCLLIFLLFTPLFFCSCFFYVNKKE